jgi:hypothetical protein
VKGVLVFAVLLAAARPAAARVELVLPAGPGRSAPEVFLMGLAASKLVPAEDVRAARGRESAGLFVEAELANCPGGNSAPAVMPPEVARALAAIGLREITLQAFPDGEVLRLVASLRFERGAPALPFTNRELPPPAMEEQPNLRGWASGAVSLDTGRLIPWLLAVLDRRDNPGRPAARSADRPRRAPGTGQFLRDALAVMRQNLELDLERDVVRALGGTVRLRAGSWLGTHEAALLAEVRSPEALEKALAKLSTVSQIMGKAGPRLDAARFAGTNGYRLRLPWQGPQPALALAGGRLVAATHPRLMENGAPRLVRALSGAREDRLPRPLGEVGHLDRCAVAVVDVLTAARAARRAARVVGLDETLVPSPSRISWADGTAALAVRVGEDGLQVFGAWVAGRSALGRGSDECIAGPVRR